MTLNLSILSILDNKLSYNFICVHKGIEYLSTNRFYGKVSLLKLSLKFYVLFFKHLHVHFSAVATALGG